MSLRKDSWLNMLEITKTESSNSLFPQETQVQIRRLGETLGKPGFLFFTDVFEFQQFVSLWWGKETMVKKTLRENVKIKIE